MRETARYLLQRLAYEREHKMPGGIYQMLQVEMAYHSNRIEGSGLTLEQTQSLFEGNTLSDCLKSDDVTEAVNHFRCLDIVLDLYDKSVTEEMIKTLQRTLKRDTYSSQRPEAVLGEYKKYPNVVGNTETAAPKDVPGEIRKLVDRYNSIQKPALDDILDFHVRFEKIHPFYDGNGRVGRLLMFKQCLKADIVPFVIEEDYRAFYYRGLKNWETEKGYLRDTCLLMQDHMKSGLRYCRIAYLSEEK